MKEGGPANRIKGFLKIKIDNQSGGFSFGTAMEDIRSIEEIFRDVATIKEPFLVSVHQERDV